MDSGIMISRMVRASRLERELYEEVEHDATLMQEAITVIVLVAILSGFGAALSTTEGFSALGLIGGVVSAVVGYVVWAAVTLVVGRGLFHATADVGEVLRTLGYASSPQALLVLQFLPVLGGLLSLVVWIWVIATGIVAIRQALDITTGQAVATAIVGAVIMAIVMTLVLIPFGIAMGVGALLSGA